MSSYTLKVWQQSGMPKPLPKGKVTPKVELLLHLFGLNGCRQTKIGDSRVRGVSGGEKKRNEILQMALLQPKLAILDETDSGLDIDALKIVADGVNAMRGPEFSALVITHYQRLLDYIVPDRVHVLMGGRIVRSGGPELAKELEAQGYGAIQAAA